MWIEMKNGDLVNAERADGVYLDTWDTNKVCIYKSGKEKVVFEGELYFCRVVMLAISKTIESKQRLFSVRQFLKDYAKWHESEYLNPDYDPVIRG